MNNMKNYRSKATIRILLDMLPDPAAIADEKGNFLTVNNAFQEKIGLNGKELVGTSILELNIVSPESKAIILENLKNRTQGAAVESYEVCFTAKAGETRLVEVTGKTVRYAGHPASLVVFHDVTDRKNKVEEQIKFSEEKYKNLFENAPAVVVTIDLTGKITSANKAIMQYGFKENEIVGNSIFKLVPIEEKQKMRAGFKNIAAGKPAQGEIEILTPNGQRNAEYNSNPIWQNGKVIGYQTIIRDVTKRKKAEARVKELQEFQQLEVDRMPIGLIVWGMDFRVKTWNPSAARIFGFTQQEAFGKHPYDFIVPKQAKPNVEKIWRRLLEGDLTANSINENVTKDGRTLLCEWSNTPLKKDGAVIGILSMIQDITEGKKAEEALKESEKRSRAIVANSPMGIATSGADKHFLSANETFCRVLGYTEDELQKLTFKDITHPEDLKASALKMCELENGKISSFTLEKRYVKKDGAVINGKIMVNAVTDQNGKPSLFVAELEDTTEARRVQEALMKSEMQYRQLVNIAQEGIWAFDSNYCTVFVNPRMANMLGYAESEMVGKNLCDFVIKAEVEQAIQYLAQFKRGAEGTFEYEFPRKDGSKVYTSIAASQIKDDEGNRIGTLALVSDITLRKKTENELKQESQKLETITESIGVGLTITSKDYRILWTNKVMKQIRGVKDLEGRKCYATYNYLDTVCPDCGVRKVFEGKDFDSREYMVFDKERGSTVWMQLIATPIKDNDGTVTSALELVLPITERKMMEQSLKGSEERFRTILNSALDAIIAIDDAMNVAEWNPAASRIFGYTQEEIIGKPISKLIPFSVTQTATQEIRRFVETSPQESIGRLIEIIGLKKDGAEFFAELSFSKMQINGKNHGVAFVRDITERKQVQKKLQNYSRELEETVAQRTAELRAMQDRLLKAERLAAIGELAGMVGHDLRNPLQGIKNAAFYLKRKDTTISEAQGKEMLETIDKAIDHANKIINDLLEYSREIHLELREYALHTLLEDALRIIQIPDRIQIVSHVLAETQIRVDADKMMRVFINLIKNAIDAIPEKGTLEITSYQTGDNVEISFADTGTGIPKETLQKLFSPLFTTKAQGMGFGLAICKRFIESHGGIITVKTVVNGGTTFTITLPIKPIVEVHGEKTLINRPELLLTTTRASETP
ncbi:MAG: PAS domain S-box protein [Candidatus Bathyarchaeia archaeon]|jgi:PAS domain S-box-containing protein